MEKIMELYRILKLCEKKKNWKNSKILFDR